MEHRIQRRRNDLQKPSGGIELENKAEGAVCSFREGELNSCAPLAVAYVPMQTSAQPAYEAPQALVRGTLFPGLDLPFMNLVNKGTYEGTPLGELMGLDFVIQELKLYLDTHKTDREAFETLKSAIKLFREGREKYVKLYGPLVFTDLESADSFTWLCEPWPWDYCDSMED